MNARSRTWDLHGTCQGKLHKTTINDPVSQMLPNKQVHKFLKTHHVQAFDRLVHCGVREGCLFLENGATQIKSHEMNCGPHKKVHLWLWSMESEQSKLSLFGPPEKHNRGIDRGVCPLKLDWHNTASQHKVSQYRAVLRCFCIALMKILYMAGQHNYA